MSSEVADDTTPEFSLSSWEAEGLRALGPCPTHLLETWISIPLQSGWTCPAKVVRPATSEPERIPRPLIIYWFGGGFATGSPNQVTRPAREFSELFNAVVVCPSYRLVPDVHFPTPMRDAWDMLKWAAANAKTEFGAEVRAENGGGLVVGGVSAGATLAAVVAGIWAGGGEDGSSQLAAPITGVFLGSPLLMVEEIVPERWRAMWTSREDNRDAQGLDSDGILRVVEHLRLGVGGQRSPWFSPVNVLEGRENAGSLAGMPVYLQVGGMDPLRDDAVVFAKLLEEKGIPAKVDIFPNDAHCAWTVLQFETKSREPTVEQATLAGMEWVLCRTSSSESDR